MDFNEKIVTKPVKVDLHIHSKYSITKDDNKIVGEGKEENLSILVNKLNENHINMASITDHDYFSFNMYKAFKSFEGTGDLKKVLPGVEFSVGIKDDNNEYKQVHVIAIFDDSDEKKLELIETKVLNLNDGKVKYDLKEEKLFSEGKLLEILKDIGLNTVLIAHQKNSVTSETAKEPDLKSIGERKFNVFLTSEIFEALEFKSMRNGLFNNTFALKKNEEYEYDIVKFITGSDCHQWNVYPAHDETELEYIDEYKPTFLKCLPTFKGLTMALSDYSRIQLGDSYFSSDDSKLEMIELKINGVKKTIPLSPGINAIIGDNSIGKSLLFHKLRNYSEITDSKVKSGYDEYLKNNHISIESRIDNSKLYYFDYQGNIRKRFENKNEALNQEFLFDKFPENPVSSKYKTIIENQFEKLYESLNIKFKYDSEYSKLSTLLMTDHEVIPKTISVSSLSNNKTSITDYSKIINYLNEISRTINEPNSYKKLEKEDLELIEKFKVVLRGLICKYNNFLLFENYKYKIKNGIKEGITDFKNSIKVLKDQNTQIKESFENDCAEVAHIIAELINLRRNIKKFAFDISGNIDVESSSLNYNEYKFIKRFKDAQVINNKYLENILSLCLKRNKKINTSTITESELAKNLKDYPGSPKKPVDFLKEKVDEKIDDHFEVEAAILKSEQNVYDNLSSGLNSTLYFDIISGDLRRGIYLIDQPEDDVSQTAIKNNLIRDFKKMSQARQILLITHNPQFVVNLDVDNVICIYRDKNNNIEIVSGALEYEDSVTKTNIIQFVADNLDGGVDAIRKRWKRYGKELGIN